MKTPSRRKDSPPTGSCRRAILCPTAEVSQEHYREYLITVQFRFPFGTNRRAPKVSAKHAESSSKARAAPAPCRNVGLFSQVSPPDFVFSSTSGMLCVLCAFSATSAVKPGGRGTGKRAEEDEALPHDSASRSALASFKSRVANPSVNQLYTSANSL